MTSRNFTLIKIVFVIAISSVLGWLLLRNENRQTSDRKISLTNFEKNSPPTERPFELIEPKDTRSVIYVGVNGNDKNTGASFEQALSSIQLALDKAQPGDKINIGAGEYRQDLKTVRDGRFDAPIIISGTQQAVIKGGGNARIIQIAHDYIVLEGFTVDGLYGDSKEKDGYRDKLIYLQSELPLDGVEGVRMLNLSVKNAGGECIRMKYFAKHNEISGNTIENCGIRDFVFDRGKKNGEGIYIGTAPEQIDDGKNPTEDIDASDENWIHHNKINTRGNECVDIKEGSNRNLIEYNDCTGQKDEESGGLDARGNLNTFRNNTVYDNVGAGIRLGGDKKDQGINNSVYDNLIRNNDSGGIKVMRFPQTNLCNNQFKKNGKDDFVGEYADEAEDLENSCH